MTGFFRRSFWAKRVLVSGLTVVFTCATCSVRAVPAGQGALHGARTSDAAARKGTVPQDTSARTLAGWRPASTYGATAASDDTTDVDFPEDEEQKRKHLYRDIGVFLIVSVFVGYFIVKVFLEGDTDEPPPPKKGKEIPGF